MLYLRCHQIIYLEVIMCVNRARLPSPWNLTRMTVYVYRTVLDSINGVSSTRHTSLAAVTLREGEVRQFQFVEDDTLMVLWSDASMCHPQFYVHDVLPLTFK